MNQILAQSPTQLSTQWQIIERWLSSLIQMPEVEVVWLEGSLVDNRNPVPGADIDMRLGIADVAYGRLWIADKSQVLAGLVDILRLIDRDWIRAVTREGVIVELAVRKSSELAGLALHNWEILLNRRPAGEPNFIKLPKMSPAEVWTEEHDCTPEFVWQQMEIAMTVLANCPAPFYNRELESAKFTLDDFRITLIKLMYRDVGVYFAKRYKHFSEILTPECLADLRYTYLRPGADQQEPAALAEATLRTYEKIGKYLERLGRRYGGKFAAEWYWLLHEQIEASLAPILHTTAR